MSKPKKVELIEEIFNIYKDKTSKPDDWYAEMFDKLSDYSVARLEAYLKVLKTL
jgi:hypothetical protein